MDPQLRTATAYLPMVVAQMRIWGLSDRYSASIKLNPLVLSLRYEIVENAPLRFAGTFEFADSQLLLFLSSDAVARSMICSEVRKISLVN